VVVLQGDRVKKILLFAACALIAGWGAISFVVQLEGPYRQEEIGSAAHPRGKALILYHPSRDAHFAEDLSSAVAQGLVDGGYAVTLETMTSRTPARPEGFDIVAVVSNTYYGAPDLPTTRYLKRARFDGMLALGLMGGAGSTDRSQKILDEALHRTNATVLATRSFWTMRPNDESRMKEPNRDVATDLARQFARQATHAAPPEQVTTRLNGVPR
jgi:hypothetical protein